MHTASRYASHRRCRIARGGSIVFYTHGNVSATEGPPPLVIGYRSTVSGHGTCATTKRCSGSIDRNNFDTATNSLNIENRPRGLVFSRLFYRWHTFNMMIKVASACQVFISTCRIKSALRYANLFACIRKIHLELPRYLIAQYILLVT